MSTKPLQLSNLCTEFKSVKELILNSCSLINLTVVWNQNAAETHKTSEVGTGPLDVPKMKSKHGETA